MLKMNHPLSQVSCCCSESGWSCGSAVGLGAGPVKVPDCCKPPYPQSLPVSQACHRVCRQHCGQQATPWSVLSFPQQGKHNLQCHTAVQACRLSGDTDLDGQLGWGGPGGGPRTVPTWQWLAPLSATVAPHTCETLCSVLSCSFSVFSFFFSLCFWPDKP